MIERDDLLARSRRVGATIMDRFDGFAQRFDVVGDVRAAARCVRSSWWPKGTKEPLGAETMNADRSHGGSRRACSLTAGTCWNVVRLLPPIAIDDALLADGLDVLDAALGAVTG